MPMRVTSHSSAPHGCAFLSLTTSPVFTGVMGTATGLVASPSLVRYKLKSISWRYPVGGVAGVAQMKTRAILSVLGEDRVGIVAAVSSALAEAGTNIEDIRQTILAGVFSMTMLVTVDEDRTPFEDVQARLATVGEDLGMQITLQREDVFRYMHRI